MCIPLPACPRRGMGMNDACSPSIAATVRTTCLNSTALSAALITSANAKSTSF